MKKFCFVFCSILVLPFVLFGCSFNKEDKLNEYNIQAVFNDQSMSLDCLQEIKYFNNSNNVLKELKFFLYANSFSENVMTVSNSYVNKAYPNGYSFGNIDVHSIYVNNNVVQFFIPDSKEYLLIEFGSDLYPEESVVIKLEYTIILANINHRLGYGQNAINFGNFFPIACVYEDGSGFVETKFATNGDPFYSEVANFEVELIFPKEYVLASSGVQKRETIDGINKIVQCQGKKIRDFAFVLSKNFQLKSKKLGDVIVNYYFYDDELSENHLQTAVNAIKTFGEIFGDYPYEQISIVKTNFCYGGMEYPNLVMISDDITDQEMFNYVVVHELAHQWWYGIVGNNEYSEAWLDEGLTEFSTALFFENNPEYGLKYDEIMENARQTYVRFVEIFENIKGDVDESLNRNLSEFETEPEYVNCAYTKGMLLFDSLRETMSERKFFNCLKTYFEDFSYKNASTQDMIKSFSNSSHTNLESYFSAWIDGKVVL